MDFRNYVIAIADRMNPGEQWPFPNNILLAGFGAELAVQGALEAAVCSHLRGSAYGTYSLHEDRKTRSHILLCHKPNLD